MASTEAKDTYSIVEPEVFDFVSNDYGHLSFEQKLAEASKIMKEAAAQLKKSGLELNFEMRIKAGRPAMVVKLLDEPAEQIL